MAVPAKLTPTPTAAVPVYALVGSDSFLQLEALSRLLKDLPPDAQRVDADGERAELSDVLDELRSFAMFGGGKCVVVRTADAFITRFREQLEDYVASPSDSSTLVLRLPSLPSNQRIYKAISSSSVCSRRASSIFAGLTCPAVRRLGSRLTQR